MSSSPPSSQQIHVSTEPSGNIPGLEESPGLSNLAVCARDLGKCYNLWARPQDRLKHGVIQTLRRWLPLRDRRYYREFWALRNITFQVEKGQTYGIIGKNGSGKSTLLQLICQTLAPTTGSVNTYGRVAALLELGSGFNPEYTGRENVYLNGAILGLSREEISERYHAILEFADIGDFIDQPVKLYSSGMTMRLAFAVMAHVDAEILVIDEALAVGDAFFRQKCYRFLREFQQDGTLLFVSHDTGAVTNLCERAILLDKGELKAEGNAREIAEMYLEMVIGSRQTVKDIRNHPASTAHGSSHHGDQGNVESIEPVLGDDDPVDQRQQYINVSPLRNDLEVFEFDPSKHGFGSGEGRITSVRILDHATGKTLTWMVGGEKIVLVIQAIADIQLEQPIIGFYVKDSKGQELFGDNTFLTYRDTTVCIKPGIPFEARFSFRMPMLRRGDYFVTAALARGTQQDHVQLHWIHEALSFKSHSARQATGLVGIPIQHIELKYCQ